MKLIIIVVSLYIIFIGTLVVLFLVKRHIKKKRKFSSKYKYYIKSGLIFNDVDISWYKTADCTSKYKLYSDKEAYKVEKIIRKKYKKDKNKFLNNLYDYDEFYGQYGYSNIYKYERPLCVPSIFFDQYLRKLKIENLNDNYIFDYVVDLMVRYAPSSFKNKNKYKSSKEPCTLIEDYLNYSKNYNIILKYAFYFDAFKIKDDESGDKDNKKEIFIDVLNFLSKCIEDGNDKDSLNKNSFLLEKSTYIDKNGNVISEKDFLKLCSSKISGSSYFKNLLKEKNI